MRLAAATARSSASSRAEIDEVDEIVEFLADYVGLVGVSAESRLGEDVPFDSFAIVDTLAFLEERFACRVPPAEIGLADFATPTAIAALLTRFR